MSWPRFNAFRAKGKAADRAGILGYSGSQGEIHTVAGSNFGANWPELYRESHGNVAATRQRRAMNAPPTRRVRGTVKGGVERVEDWRIAEDRPEKILHWKGVDEGLATGLKGVVSRTAVGLFDRGAGPPPTPSRLREGE